MLEVIVHKCSLTQQILLFYIRLVRSYKVKKKKPLYQELSISTKKENAWATEPNASIKEQHFDNTILCDS